jgi:Carboxypeptidase regulatory-like domain
VTTHRRPWRLRAGLVATLVASAIGVVALPTAAFADTNISASPSSVDLQPGGNTSVTITVSADVPGKVTINPPDFGNDVNVTVNSSLSCSTQSNKIMCDVPGGGGNKNITLKMSADATVSVGAGQTKTSSGTASIEGASPASFAVTLHGPAQQQPTQNATTVTKITGTVKDSATGNGIAGAKVELQDGNSNSFSTTSNNAGAYQFTSTSAKPIVAGLMAITATKDGYSYDPKSFQTSAGQPATFDIVMLSTAPTASAAVPDGGISSAPAASDSASDVVPATASDTGSSNHYMTFMIIAGALLILAGIGAILTLVLRRRKEDEDDEDEDDVPPPPRRGPPPGRPGGGYRAAEPTVVARDPGYNDRTAIVRPVEDEYPDPYGAPPPRTPAPAYGGAGQYGGQRPGYGQQAQPGGFDQPTTYSPAGRPAADPYASSGYGDSGRGGRYDEPTGVYNGGGQYGAGEPTAPGGQYGGDSYGSGGQYGGGQYGAPGQQGGGRPYDGGGQQYNGGDQYGGASYGGQYGGAPQGGAGQYGSGYQDDRYPPAADPYRDDARHGADAGYGDPAPRSAPPRGGQPQPGRQYGGYDQAYDQQGYGEQRPTSGAPRPTSGAPRPTSGAPRGYGQPTQQYGGYDQAYADPRGGYDQQQDASRHSAAPGRGGQEGGGRRSLDWLDD